MKPRLVAHIHDLPVPPVLDVLGKWIHLCNARVATTSIDEGPLRDRCIMNHRGNRNWENVWRHVIVPNIDDLVIFTFVRNPWERVLSAFYQCRDKAKTKINQIDPKWYFNDWVKKVLAKHGPSVNMHFAEQYDTAFFEGEPFSFVGRFENMRDDWQKLSKMIGVDPHLPHWNAVNHDWYVDHYDEDSRRIIGEMYHRDVIGFGYEFGK